MCFHVIKSDGVISGLFKITCCYQKICLCKNKNNIISSVSSIYDEAFKVFLGELYKKHEKLGLVSSVQTGADSQQRIEVKALL